jgi:hypothetical protein
MVESVKKFCGRTGQRIPTGMGEIARCIEESFALKRLMVGTDVYALLQRIMEQH